MASAMRAAGALFGIVIIMCAGHLLLERFGGASGAFDAQALDPGTHLEERPGELDYCHNNATEIWSTHWEDFPESTITTPLECVDIDGDGVDEVVFGTYDGRILVLDPVMHGVLLDMSVTEENIDSIDVGNVDEDPGMELICIAHKAQGTLDTTTLVCVDCTSRAVQWSSPGQVVPEQVSLFDDDEDGVLDIFVTGYFLARYEHWYWRYDGSGREVMNGSLTLPSAVPAALSTHIIGDLDGDGDYEAFFIDKYSYWSIDRPVKGRNLWMIDLGTGAIELARSYPELIFYSDPMLLQHSGRAEVLAGLGCSSSDGMDLWVLDLATGNHTLHDLSNGSLGEDQWTQLSMAPGPDGPVVLMNSANDARLAWSTATGLVLWGTAADSKTATLSHTVVCDIDGDGSYELISPFGSVTVLDALSGVLEADLRIHGKMAVGDLDGDGLSELLLNVAEDLARHHSEGISVLDSPSYIEWEAAPTNGTVTLYADVEGVLELMVKRMTKAQTPPLMSLVLSNPGMGDFRSLELDIRNGTMAAPNDARLKVLGFERERTESALFVRLRMEPCWGFSWGGPNEVRMLFDDRRGQPHECRVAEAFTVERDLVLVGALNMRLSGAPLAAGSWVRPDVGVVVSGFDVVYEGTLDLRPARAAFRIISQVDWRRTEHFCHDADRLAVEFMVPWHNGPLLVSLGVNETLAGIVGRNSLETTLRVDSWRPIVIEPEGLDRWYGELPVEVTVYFDEPDSGMGESGVWYALTKLRTDEVTRWYEVYANEFGRTDDPAHGRGTHWARLRIYAPEGLGYLRIEASDRVGNRNLHWSAVRVDRTPPTIRAILPAGWQRTDRVELQVEIADIDGSGVDPRTVLVSSSNEDPPVFRNWRPMSVVGEGERVTASVVHDGIQGRSNHLVFKAWDMLDHETTSGPVTIWVDSLAPEVWVEHPLDGEVLDPPFTALQFRVHILENGSELDEVLPSLVDLASNQSVRTEYVLEMPTDGHCVATVRWYRTSSDRYEFSVRCTDVAGNAYATVPIRVSLNEPPLVEILSPHDGDVLIAGHEHIFKVDVQDDGGSQARLTCEWALEGRPWVTGTKRFSNASIPAGTYTVTVRVSDGVYSVSDRISVTVVEPVEPPEQDGDAPSSFAPPSAVDALTLVVLLSMLVLLLALRRRWRR